jgi:acyl-CoA thioesterase
LPLEDRDGEEVAGEADAAGSLVGGAGARRGRLVSGALYELDEDTDIAPVAAGRYGGELVSRWNVGIGMNGGYLAVFCLRAVLAESQLPDPLSMTIHYLSRPLPGRAEVHVATMRTGRGHATYRFELVQDEVRASGLVLTGRLRDPGPFDFAPDAPVGPGPDESRPARRASASAEAISLWSRLDTRVAHPDDLFYLRSEPGEARTGGWTRLADGRPTDVLCVPLFLDCWPPAVFSRTMRPDDAGAPTLELTVHWRNRVPSGWLNARFHSRQLSGGYIDENGELWSEDGVLVAESRQLARYAARGGAFA